MSRVIKNNDGVAIVEGTPASSLVKDVNKFFAAKPPERMAGESVYQPRKIDPRAINTRRPTPKDLDQINNPLVEESTMRSGRRPSFENLSAQEQAEVAARRNQMMEDRKAKDPLFRREPRTKEQIKAAEEKAKRNKDFSYKEAKEKAKARKERFFQRRRSRKEAERSQREQEATQGKFITTLGT